MTSRSRARSSRPSTPRFVCGSSPRSSARSHTHTTYEVKSACPYSSRRRATSGVDLRLLAGQHQQLLDVVARDGAIEQRQHLVGRVQMRLVRRERAVLAVAAARPRQRQREVAAERDTAAHARGSFYVVRLSWPRLMRGAMVARAAAGLRSGRRAPPAAARARARPRARRARPRPGSPAPAALRSATLILDFTPNAVHTGIYAALARHYDRDDGVRLHVVAPTATTDSIKLLETGRVDFAILDIHDLAIADERRHPPDIVGIMAIVERPLAAVIAAPDVSSPKAAGGQDRRDHRRPERHGGAASRRSPDRAATPPRSRRSRSASTRSPTCSPAASPAPPRSGTTRA